MRKYFVEFHSPGTFVSEVSVHEIEWIDIQKAKEMANSIHERYGAKPFAFQFIIKERKDDELDSRIIEKSDFYYLPHCKVFTLADIVAEKDPKNNILIGNMKCNGWDKIIMVMDGWSWTLPFEEGDVLLT